MTAGAWAGPRLAMQICEARRGPWRRLRAIWTCGWLRSHQARGEARGTRLPAEPRATGRGAVQQVRCHRSEGVPPGSWWLT